MLRALDDTRHSYITGTGEEIFTYDMSAVNKMRKDLSKMQSDERKEKETTALQDEIKQMKEELKRTQEINKLDIDVRELQLKALESNTEAMNDLLNKSKENLNNVYDNLGEQLVDEFKKATESMVATHEKIWTEYLARMSVDSVPENFMHNKNQSYYGNTTESIKAGQTLKSVADKYGITVDQLKKYNGVSSKDGKTFDKDSTVKFDSGGYTGDFSGGKMAMLHEKELILNKHDTSNMLKMVDVTRSIANGLSVDNGMFNKSRSDKENNNPTISIANVNLPSVKDGKSFVNELHSLLRKGQNRLI